MNPTDAALSMDVPTPYLSMDLQKVTSNYDRLAAALPEVDIRYAMKCNPDGRIVSQLHSRGCGFEIASYGELTELMALGVRADEVIFSNPVKVPAHIERAFADGVWRFAFDSESELEKIARLAPGSAVYVRLATPSPASAVHSEGKFGVTVSRAATLMRLAVERGLQPYGVTFHVGSQNLALEAWESALSRVGELMRSLGAAGIRLSMVDVGGGFPIDYGDAPPAIEEYAHAIRRAIAKYLPYDVEIIAEPGRYLVADAGVFVASVIGVAKRGKVQWIHLDLGAFNGMMEALETGNQLRFPVSDELQADARKLFNLTGPSCDSQDSILFEVPLSAGLSVGDRVFIHNAGAYTTAYASRFNGFDLPETYCWGGEPLAEVITIDSAETPTIDLTLPVANGADVDAPSVAS